MILHKPCPFEMKEAADCPSVLYHLSRFNITATAVKSVSRTEEFLVGHAPCP
jgi:hypothetical protein